MTSLFPAIENLSLLDLSLPGTHDSMTFDLSTTVSDGTNDLPPPIAWVLHEFHDLVPGQFIRNQSKTHGLNLTEQLNNGIRFVDFRIMYTSGPNESASAQHEWYCSLVIETTLRLRKKQHLFLSKFFLFFFPDCLIFDNFGRK